MSEERINAIEKDLDAITVIITHMRNDLDRMKRELAEMEASRKDEDLYFGAP